MLRLKKFTLLLISTIGLVSWPNFPETSAQQVTGRQSESTDQKNSAEQQRSNGAAAAETFGTPLVEIDGKRRKQLLGFVRENHPELEPLIKSLREKRPRQYESALRSLDKSVSALHAIKDGGNLQRYEQSLKIWKQNSRIQLLSAQLSIEDTPSRRNQLKRLLTQQAQDRREQLTTEQERLRARLKRLNDELSKSTAEQNAEIEKRMTTIASSAERFRQKRQAEKKQEDENKANKKAGNKKTEDRKEAKSKPLEK